MSSEFETEAKGWADCSPRERLARLLLVRSEFGPDGLPSASTIDIAHQGVGTFHGPPMLEHAEFHGPKRALEFNLALRTASIEQFGVPPLIGGNTECGVSYTIRTGGTDVPYPAALGLGDTSLSETAGRTVGSELLALGYGWAFQPVIDVRTETRDPVIGVRAFSDDPAVVAAHGVAFINGLQSTGLLAVAKHFPGHGDAEVDSHLGLPVVARTPEEHERIHLSPFRAAVDAGVQAIMTAHVVLPELGITEPATFSRHICTTVLRQQMGFNGLLVTDSLRMAAIADRYGYVEAYKAGLHAGSDVLNIRCWPEEVPALLDELEAEFRGGSIDEQRLGEAFERVLAAQRQVPEPTGELPSEHTRRLMDDRLVALLKVDDPDAQLPLALNGVLGVLVASPRGTDAPPLTLLDALSSITGQPARRVDVADSMDSLNAVLVVAYGQAEITEEEWALIEHARGLKIPAAVLVAGPRHVHAPTGLPTVELPTIDVFGLASMSGLVLALHRLFDVS